MSIRAAISFFLLLCSAMSAQAQKNDTIYLLNGDRITGELKKFEYGQLTLSTEAMQKVYIDFEKISSIHSTKYYEVRSSSGFRYFGYLLKAEEKGKIVVVTASDTLVKVVWDIVLIVPIRQSFIQKIDGSVDLGLSYTKASDVLQYSFSGNISFRNDYFLTQLDINSIVTNDASNKVTRNNNYVLNQTRYLPSKWFFNAQGQAQQNTELDLDLRLQLGLGAGYDLIRTNTNRLYGRAGLLVNQEKALSNGNTAVNVEAVINVEYKWFQYHHPKIDITTYINYLPSLNVSGRQRFEYNLKAKYEVISDLFLSIQFYDNFDNMPTSGEGAKNDYGVVFSVGYTF